MKLSSSFYINRKERLEKERKEKKKQKEKERIARKKQEGTFESKEQKEARQRALLQLEAMGVKIPPVKTDDAPEENKQKVKPKYGRLRKNKDNNKNDQAQKEETPEKSEEIAIEGVDPVVEEVKDSWDVDEDEVIESKKAKAAAAEKKTETQDKKADDKPADNESESEEESESEQEQSSSEEEEEEISKDLPPIEKAKLRITVIIFNLLLN